MQWNTYLCHAKLDYVRMSMGTDHFQMETEVGDGQSEVALCGLHFSGVTGSTGDSYRDIKIELNISSSFQHLLGVFSLNDILDVFAHSEIWKMENQVYQHYSTNSNPYSTPNLFFPICPLQQQIDWTAWTKKKNKGNIKITTSFSTVQHQDLALTSNAVAGASFWQWLPQPSLLGTALELPAGQLLPVAARVFICLRQEHFQTFPVPGNMSLKMKVNTARVLIPSLAFTCHVQLCVVSSIHEEKNPINDCL